METNTTIPTTPITPPKMATITYKLSKEGQKASILAGGNGAEKQTLTTPVTPELLALNYTRIDKEGEVSLNLARTSVYVNRKLTEGYQGEPKVTGDEEDITFDAPQTAEQLIAWDTARQELCSQQMVELQPILDAKHAEWRIEKKRKETEDEASHKKATAIREAQKAEREAKEEAEREAKAKEKSDWIAQYGSEYLKKAHKLDYSAQRAYVTERAAMEYPDYEVDFDDRARWSSRSAPTMEALEEVESLIAAGVEAEVVWLTHPTRKFEDSDEEEDWENQEAIAIRKFLGKYDLIKEM